MTYNNYNKKGNGKYLQRKVRALEAVNRRIRTLNTILILAVGGLLLLLVKQTTTIGVQKLEISKLEDEAKINAVTISELKEKNSDMVDNMAKLASAAIDINEELNTLKTEYNQNMERLQELEERAELYDKYDYALYCDGERTDVTYQRIKDVQRYCTEAGLSDESVGFIMALVSTESHGDATIENEESTAAGLGQLLYDTATYIYEEEMGNGEGSYKYELALDPDTNLEMTTFYVSYLIKHYGDDPESVLKAYRGKDSKGYKEAIEEKLNMSNLSLNTMNLTSR